MSKITKTTILFIVTVLLSLIIPIIGEWYYHKTNIFPLGFYFICGFGGLGMIAVRLHSIWDNNKY
jgi:NADH:ubiquinone oxidoreductase subunit H